MALALLIERALDVEKWVGAFYAGAGMAKDIEVHTFLVFGCWFQRCWFVVKDFRIGLCERRSGRLRIWKRIVDLVGLGWRVHG
jgi:hypothetical protein